MSLAWLLGKYGVAKEVKYLTLGVLFFFFGII